jgi:hypothetical protein
MVSAVLIGIEERTGMKKELLTVKECQRNSAASTALNCRKLPQTA